MNVKDIFVQNGLLIQEKPYTCGPSTLQNVLKLKGNDSYTEDELAKLCEANPEVGTTNQNMVKVAKAVGLKVVEERANSKVIDLENHLDAGNHVIVCYLNAFSGNGHYGFITEHDDLAFYFRDCDHGLFRLEKKEFKNFWYGKDGNKQWFMAIE